MITADDFLAPHLLILISVVMAFLAIESVKSLVTGRKTQVGSG